MSGALDFKCPKCKAPPQKRCRTLTTNRVTDTHEARYAEMAEGEGGSE